ncbi:hypothetical protein TIFTF001_020441 [Ficus carica]|uniref:Uncharacterized protein n=1 Tax=Ficus carica TaxID=3494 RepID=A0AA88AG24_FICCA|nr:hypothetical protein TIFTF001_020441 [Ficus carica]
MAARHVVLAERKLMSYVYALLGARHCWTSGLGVSDFSGGGMGPPALLVDVGRAIGNVVTEATMVKMGLVSSWLAMAGAVRGGWARLV